MLNHFAFLDLSTADLILILVIILLLFGGRKLTDLSRSIGQSAKELRKGFSDDDEPQETTKKAVKKNSK